MLQTSGEKSCGAVGRENWGYDFPASTLLVQVRIKSERFKLLAKDQERKAEESGVSSTLQPYYLERSSLLSDKSRGYEVWITLLSQTPDKVYKLNHADYLYFF